jgi:serine/threonine-protein kinase
VVPSVVGQSPSHAGSILQAAGLAVGSQSTGNSCSSQATGLVAAQNPSAGQTVQANTPVNLILSPGPCVTVPGVVGQSQGAATAAISGNGLVANTTFDSACPGNAQPGNVDTQSPSGNAQVTSGSTVNISVCQSAATTTTSTSTTTTTTTTSTVP